MLQSNQTMTHFIPTMTKLEKIYYVFHLHHFSRKTSIARHGLPQVSPQWPMFRAPCIQRIPATLIRSSIHLVLLLKYLALLKKYLETYVLWLQVNWRLKLGNDKNKTYEINCTYHKLVIICASSSKMEKTFWFLHSK